MFSKQNKAGAPPAQASVPATQSAAPRKRSEDTTPSLISAGLSVLGDMVSEGAIQIDGTVEGDIKCPDLTVGNDATVRGSINVDIARISGSVTGRIQARQVELSKSAQVQGDIIHEMLSIEAGAFVDGNFKRMDTTTHLSEVKTEQPKKIAAEGDD
jgi:cytoskeletal protein CcmA (bactofilin family)